MAQCSAINSALAAKGYDNATLAAQVGLSHKRVNSILSGQEKPTTQEFNSIAKALDLPSAPPSAPHAHA